MTATVPTVEQVDNAIVAGYERRPAEWISSPEFDLNNAIGNLTLFVQDQFWPRHECTGEWADECDGDSSCPRAPAWEEDLAQYYNSAMFAIESDFLASAQRHLRRVVERFAVEHPEAEVAG